MNQLLEELIEIAPLYAKSLQQEAAIGISDLEQYLALFETETLKFPFPVGTKIKDVGYQELLDEISRTGEPVINYASKEITGSVAIKTIIAPVYDNGEFVGCMSLSINMESEMQLDNFSSILKVPINNVYNRKERISAMELVALVNSAQIQLKQIQDKMQQGLSAIKPLYDLIDNMNEQVLNQALKHPKTDVYEKEISKSVANLHRFEKQCKGASEEINKWVNDVVTTCDTLYKYIG